MDNKETELVTIFANEEGIITEEAIIEKFHLQNYNFFGGWVTLIDDNGKEIETIDRTKYPIRLSLFSFKLRYKGEGFAPRIKFFMGFDLKTKDRSKMKKGNFWYDKVITFWAVWE